MAKIKRLVHKATTHQELRIIAMIDEYGLLGYGVYWYLLERIAIDEQNRIENGPELVNHVVNRVCPIKSTNQQNSTNRNNVQQTVTTMLHDFIKRFNLMYEQEGYLYSCELVDKAQKAAQISLIRSKAGQESAKVKAAMKAMQIEIQYPTVQKTERKKATSKDNIYISNEVQSTKGGAGGKQNTPPHTFTESPFSEYAQFEAAMIVEGYVQYDLLHYFKRVKAWGMKGNKKENWLSVGIQFILTDEQNKKAVSINSENTYPNHWDANYAKKLNAQQMVEYAKHLTALGFVRKYSPGGGERWVKNN